MAEENKDKKLCPFRLATSLRPDELDNRGRTSSANAPGVFCHPQCAWRMGEDCAVKVIASNLQTKA